MRSVRDHERMNHGRKKGMPFPGSQREAFGQMQGRIPSRDSTSGIGLAYPQRNPPFHDPRVTESSARPITSLAPQEHGGPSGSGMHQAQMHPDGRAGGEMSGTEDEVGCGGNGESEGLGSEPSADLPHSDEHTGDI